MFSDVKSDGVLTKKISVYEAMMRVLHRDRRESEKIFKCLITNGSYVEYGVEVIAHIIHDLLINLS